MLNAYILFVLPQYFRHEKELHPNLEKFSSDQTRKRQGSKVICIFSKKGLPLDREAPSIATLSRVFADLTKKNLAKQLFDDLVKRCRQEGIIEGSHVAIDSAAIHTYEKKQPKKKSEQTGHANWGAKFDSFVNRMTWFGYKFHLAVDTKSELPLALEVTPAHVNDGEMALSLREKVHAETSRHLDTVRARP